MHTYVRRLVFLGGLSIAGAGLGCDGGAADDSTHEATLSALMDDGDVGAIAPGAMVRPGPTPPPPPPRFCPGGDCTRAPLAFWRLDDCNPFSTELADTASSSISHPAFRAVSAACVQGVSGQGVRIAGDDDVVYAPDQPDFVFGAGLTAALWVNPDRVTGTQTLLRKRLDGTSSFLLAIDGKKIHFVVRIANGKLVDLSAPIKAGRFTHVAGTHDGKQAVLYIDGAVADKAKAVGSIAAGVVPIFVGNDANGRELKGVVDEIWLNTLAAPADVIKGLTCIRKAPVVSLSPTQSLPQAAGATVPFDLSVTNPSGVACPADTFEFFAPLPFPLTSDAPFGELTVGPGQTVHATINVASAPDAAVGSYPFQVFVIDEADFQTQVEADATYVVGSTSPACFGSPPLTPFITGSPLSPAGGTFTFSAPGLNQPTVLAVPGPDGSTQALQVSVNPGVSTDPANAFLGVGEFFTRPPCLDASAFNAIKFTITGDIGTCTIAASVTTSEDTSVAFGPSGRCTGTACVPPVSAPFGTGTTVVHFADMTGGSPMATVDPAALLGVQWTLNVPTDGVTPPCVASFTISDVSFINDAVSFTFDAGTQGWFFNQFAGPGFTNIAVNPTGATPVLDFDGASGDPAPGALRMTAPFTAVDQSVDAIVGVAPPGLDLTGKTLHARVRLASGSFSLGGVQFHASSGPPFVFAGTFVNPDQLPVGVWVPIDLDLGEAAATTPGFDPSQIVQIGVGVLSGFSSNGDVFQGGDAVFEIDTVTD